MWNRLAPLALSALALAGCERASGPERPDLLLVTVDTLRTDRLGCYGGAPDAGIALCSVGERGVRFTWALSTAPSTAPALASLLTSRYPSAHGVSQAFVNALADGERTLGEELAAAGYDTAAIVSNPVLAQERGLDQGFAVYDATMTRREPNRPDYLERGAADTTDAALTWLASARAPWFLWVHYQDPHGPYDPPGAPLARDAAGARALPVLADHSGYRGIPAYQALGGARGVETYEALYRAELDYLDREVSRLLRGCCGARPAGVLLTADHGEAFGEDDYWFAHGHSLGLELIRVPLLWRPPGGTPPAVVGAPVSTLDVAPTLLAAAGIEPPASFAGTPLPLAEPLPAETPRAFFAEHPMRRAVASGSLYFARDEPGFDAPIHDALSDGLLHPLPPRALRLPPGGGVPREEPLGEAQARALHGALGERPDGAGAARALSPEQRKRLEALGYVE
jgi:arylsulfatase A-like enzyme